MDVVWIHFNRYLLLLCHQSLLAFSYLSLSVYIWLLRPINLRNVLHVVQMLSRFELSQSYFCRYLTILHCF